MNIYCEISSEDVIWLLQQGGDKAQLACMVLPPGALKLVSGIQQAFADPENIDDFQQKVIQYTIDRFS